MQIVATRSRGAHRWKNLGGVDVKLTPYLAMCTYPLHDVQVINNASSHVSISPISLRSGAFTVTKDIRLEETYRKRVQSCCLT